MATIAVYGKLDDTLQSIESQLKKVKTSDTVIVPIHSGGGTFEALNKLVTLFREAEKKKHLSLTAHALDVRSAALLFFLSFDRRVVRRTSKGSIHLAEGTFPESNARETSIMILTDRSRLSRAEAIKYEGQILSGEQLYSFGIATDIVTTF